MDQKNNNSPAGIPGRGIEFFFADGQIQYLKDGKVNLLSDMTPEVAEILREELAGDPKAIKGLGFMGLTRFEDQIRQFVICNFGDFDKNPDIAEDGTIKREYWNCGSREKCPGHGLVCKLPQVRNGQLTKNDVRLARLIKEDLVNKQIAEHLGTSKLTVDHQCAHLAQKIGCFSKPGIAAYAASQGI